MHPLHPRSLHTSTLFATTLSISFLVVALPHLLPCPVDRRKFADDGTPRRRRKRQPAGAENEEGVDEVDAEGLASVARPARECPLPKPGGVVGRVMGFEAGKEGREKAREVVVLQRLAEKKAKGGAETSGP